MTLGETFQSAIGRPTGQLSPDANGLAQYHLKIDVPSGIGHGNEPDIALIYSQGAPNGLLGMGWNLAGLSSIRLAPSSLAFDNINDYINYDRSMVRFAIDGEELLVTQGTYGKADALYRTEIETGKVILPKEKGFVMRDTAGRRFEYGTTEDSRVVSADGVTVKEWRIARQVDLHGNYVSYSYELSPNLASGAKPLVEDRNTTYIKSIVYTSNENTKYEGKRKVLFDYVARPDPVVHTVLGDVVVQAHLLSAINIVTKLDATDKILRSYKMEYSPSPVTKSSCLKMVYETGLEGGQRALIPTEFTYAGARLERDQMFRLEVHDQTTLTNSTNNVALIPLNVSGLSLTDLACIRYQPDTHQLSIKTYLASRKPVSSDDICGIEWKPSTGEGNEAQLPAIELGDGKPQPSFLAADLNGDGRTDLITPYRRSDGLLVFALSLSVGTGFQAYCQKETTIDWTDDSKFLTADLRGNGQTDVIQIYSDDKKLAFRVFSAIDQNGLTTLTDPRTLRTSEDFSNTIDWLQIETSRNGAKSLVRIHTQQDWRGDEELLASTFKLQPDFKGNGDIKPDQVSSFGVYDVSSRSKLSVLPCDINGDGVQDIVTCYVDSRMDNEKESMTFSFKTFLNDGMGKFKEYGGTITRPHAVPSTSAPKDPGRFHITNLHAADYPSLTYIYQQSDNRDFICVAFQGSCTGVVGDLECYKLADFGKLSLPAAEITVSPTDLCGTGVGDWLLYTLKDDVFSVAPVYSRARVTDFLSTVRDPMGLLSQIHYSPLTDPTVYHSGAGTANASTPDEAHTSLVLSAPNYVVSKITVENDTSVNSASYKSVHEKHYAGARINHKGRGWQGFASIQTYDALHDSTSTEVFFQNWPLTGLRNRLETSSGRFLEATVARSSIYTYDTQFKIWGDWKTCRANKASERTDLWENGKVIAGSSFGTNYGFNADGQMTSEHSWNEYSKHLWTKYLYKQFGDLEALPSGKKVTTREQNSNMAHFEEGDLSLTLVSYDDVTGLMRNMSEWSLDSHDFATRTVEFDAYGNETRAVDALGLETQTYFDEQFHCYPVKVEEKGPGVHLVRLSAYDPLSGTEVASRGSDGATICFKFDDFQRCVESRKTATAAETAGETQLAQDFLGQGMLLLTEEFAKNLRSTPTVAHRKLSFERACTKSGKNFVYTRSVLFYCAGPTGQTELIQVLDCANRTRKVSRKHGSKNRVWTYSDFDSRGLKVLQSFPMELSEDHAESPDSDWVPDTGVCIASQYDALGRLTLTTRPDSTNLGVQVVSRNEYSRGGSSVQTTIARAQSGSNPTSSEKVLSKTQVSFENICGVEKVIKSVDEAEQTTSFEYDAAGRLITVTDPGGKTESRQYNTTGKIVKIVDTYRGVVERKYDAGNNLVQESNAVNEITKYQRDAKGRVIQVACLDGRNFTFEYQTSDLDYLQKVTSSSSAAKEGFEHSIEFAYDVRGRNTETVVALASGKNYKTVMQYDWQDQITSRTLPDATVTSRTYDGGLLSSCKMSTPSWQVEGSFSQYSTFEKPETWSLTAGGALKGQFSYKEEFDRQGFPLVHSISAEKTLVEERYSYNDLQQLASALEVVSGEKTDYEYATRRLVSSRFASEPAQAYGYDKSGSLIRNADVDLSHQGNKCYGTKAGVEMLRIEYDPAGRMIKRSANGASFTFTYDGFGKLSSMANNATQSKSQFWYDHQGNTLMTKRADGSQVLNISTDFQVTLRPDGSQVTVRRIFGPDRMLATVSTEVPAVTVNSSADIPPSLNVFYTDTKGSVRAIFDSNGVLRQKNTFGAYGKMSLSREGDTSNTYEGRSQDESTGLLNFGARWYDPLAGRFIVPDDILDEAFLHRQDGMNRYAFENNDPINHVDPTGHWTEAATWAVVVSVALIGLGVALMPFTGGTSGILVAAASGALTSAGWAGMMHAIQHRDETDTTRFWRGWGSTVGINAAIGFVSGGFGKYVSGTASMARFVAASQRFAQRAFSNIVAQRVMAGILIHGDTALIGAFSSMVSKMGSNAVERDIYGNKHIGLYDGLGGAFGTGLALGYVSGVWSKYGVDRAKNTFDKGVYGREAPVQGIKWNRGEVPSGELSAATRWTGEAASSSKDWTKLFSGNTSHSAPAADPWTKMVYNNPFKQPTA